MANRFLDALRPRPRSSRCLASVDSIIATRGARPRDRSDKAAATRHSLMVKSVGVAALSRRADLADK